MKKITQILFTLLLSMVATNAFAELEEGTPYWMKLKDQIGGVDYYADIVTGFTKDGKVCAKVAIKDDATLVYLTAAGTNKWKISAEPAGKFITVDSYRLKPNQSSGYAFTFEMEQDGSYYIKQDTYTDGSGRYFGLTNADALASTYNKDHRLMCDKPKTTAATRAVKIEFIEYEDPTLAKITYQIKDPASSEVIFSQKITAKKGEAYPTPAIPNPFVTGFTGIPTGTVSKNETVEIGYTAKYSCFADVASVTQWYALDIHVNEGDYPVYAKDGMDTLYAYKNTDPALSKRRVAEGTADDYQGGSVMNDYFVWAFIGNPFTGVKLYNKGLGQYVYFNGVPDGVTDRKKAPATFVSAVGDASVFSPINNTTSVENSFALESKNAGNPKKILNQKDHIVSGYGSADGGSAMRAWAINYTTGTVNRTLAAEYGTIIVPFYAAIPDGITVYSCAAVTGNVLTLVEQTAIYPNVPYIIKGTAGTEYTFTCPTTGSYTAPATKGLLTGVYETTDLQTIAQGAGEDNTAYVLALQNSRVAFCSLEDKAYTETLPANYCYLTLKNEAGGEVKGTLYFDNETGINNVDVDANVDGKFLENGRIVIVKNNAKYNVAGQSLK